MSVFSHRQRFEERHHVLKSVTTYRPIPYPSNSLDTTSEKSENKVDPSACLLRADGRKPNEFRPIYMKIGVISQANGSAYMEMRNTKVLCGIYGPRQTGKSEFSEKGKIQCDFKFASFARQGENRAFPPDNEEKERSLLMTEALEVAVMTEKFPKAVVDVFLLVLQEDGDALSAAITCASLALADAGIEMFDLVPCFSLGFSRTEIILDPTANEEDKIGECEIRAKLLIAYMPSMNEVTQIHHIGEIEYSKMQEGIELCLDACTKVYMMMRSTLQARRGI